MRWRVMVALTGSDGRVSEAILATDARVGRGHDAATLGLAPTEGKALIAALQQVVVEAASCRALRFPPPMRLVRRAAAPAEPPHPDVEHPMRLRRVARAPLPPLTGAPDVETVRQRTLRTGARLEQAALAPPEVVSPMSQGEIVLPIDGGHVRAVKTHQQRSSRSCLRGSRALMDRSVFSAVVVGHARMIIDHATARKHSGRSRRRRPRARCSVCCTDGWARTSRCAGRRAARIRCSRSGPPP